MAGQKQGQSAQRRPDIQSTALRQQRRKDRGITTLECEKPNAIDQEKRKKSAHRLESKYVLDLALTLLLIYASLTVSFFEIIGFIDIS